ncbi:MAG: hypothetical protein ACYDCC_02145 [Actinomycetota bacterium]
MRRVVAVLAGAMIVFGGVAHAGSVCVNGRCVGAPGVYANANVSETGQVKLDGGVTGGPGIRTTGIESMTVKPDYVAIFPVVNGESFGHVGVTTDYGNQIVRVYLGPQGCRQIDQTNGLGPCIEPTP